MDLKERDPNYRLYCRRIGLADHPDAPGELPLSMCDPKYVAYRHRLAALMRGEQDDCTAHGELPPAQRSPAVIFAELVRNSGLPVRQKKQGVSNFLSSGGIVLREQLIKGCQNSGLRKFEFKLTRSLPVFDLRDVNKLVNRDCEGPDVSETESDTRPQVAIEWSGGHVALAIQPARPSPKSPTFNISSTDIIILGKQVELDQDHQWIENGTAYSCGIPTCRIPNRVNSKRIVIDVSEWFSHQLTPIRWEGNWTTDFFKFGYNYRFLQYMRPDQTVYVYWKPSLVAESFKIFAPRDKCDASSPSNPLQKTFSTVVDLYDDERLAEMMSVRDHLQTHLPETDVVGEATRLHHSRLCVLCQRRRWEAEYKDVVLKWWLAIYSSSAFALQERRVFGLPGIAREVFTPQEAPIDQEHWWVKNRMIWWPKIRPCIVFDFEC